MTGVVTAILGVFSKVAVVMSRCTFLHIKGDGITANFHKWSGGELRSRENANQMAIAVEVQDYSFARLTKYTAPTMQRNAHR